MAVDLAQSAASPRPLAQDEVALRQVLATIHAESCPSQFNFHMHTVHSDGRLQPEELVHQAIAIGLKGFAITDHHRVSGYYAAQKTLEDWRWRATAHEAKQTPHLWTGTEITSRLLETEVHILGYAFDPQHIAMRPYLQGKSPQGSEAQAAQVITAIQGAGGLAVLAHPARYRRSAGELITAAAELGIDGVETYYAYGNPDPWYPSPEQTALVKHLSHQYQLLNTCGTDTHGPNLLVRI